MTINKRTIVGPLCFGVLFVQFNEIYCVDLDRTRSTLETRRRRHRHRTEETLTIPGIFRPPSVQVEVRKFNLYGTLRKSKTEIHNTLPSPECKWERERENKQFSSDYIKLDTYKVCQQGMRRNKYSLWNINFFYP